jgi:hypothetical protein
MSSQRSLSRSERLVLEVVTGGVDRIPAVVQQTGLSRPTVDQALDRLETASLLRIHRRRGKAGSRIEVLPGARALVGVQRHLVADEARDMLSDALPIALLWLRVSRSDQAAAAEELRRTGPRVVLDCEGDASMIAIYPRQDLHHAVQVARSLPKALALERGLAVVIGLSDD